MDLDHVSNADLLSAVAGRPVGDALVQRYSSLSELSRASFDELQELPGIGPSKAAAIRAAFLVAQRLARESHEDAPLLDTPDRVAGVLREDFRQEPVERLVALLVNTRRRLIAAHTLSKGTLDSVVVHPREVFHLAIIRRASAVILAHNHPSGDPAPSEADIRVTRELARAGQLLRIEVLDHVIIGQPSSQRPQGFTSLRELGYL